MAKVLLIGAGGVAGVAAAKMAQNPDVFGELLAALLDIFARFNIVAFDNVELAPSLDPSGRSTALACKLLREELLALRILT